MELESCEPEEIIEHLLFKRADVERTKSTKETPGRIVEAYSELTKGLNKDPSRHLTTTFDGGGYDEMLTMTDIDFYSLCEHHFLPFFGSVSVAYIPDEKVTGLSKIPRMVQDESAQPHMQEKLTENITNHLNETLNPRGVMVVVEAEHLCMKMRGVEDPNSTTITSSVDGLFMHKHEVRDEFLQLIN